MSSEARQDRGVKAVSAGKIRSYVFPFAAVPTAILSAVLPSTTTPQVSYTESAPHYQYEAASAIGMDIDRRRMLLAISRYRGTPVRRVRRLRGRIVRRYAKRPMVDSPDDIKAMLIDLD